MLRKIQSLLTFSLIALSSPSFSQTIQDKLFLVGGGLKTCSSMSLSACTTKDFGEENDKKSARYLVSQQNINFLAKHWPVSHLGQQRKAVFSLLNKMKKAGNKSLTKNELRTLWLANEGSAIINQLADREYYWLLDALEQPLINNGIRTKERVSLANTRNPFSQEIFKTFVKLAAEKAQNSTPNIVVVTASARDPYEAIDFYQQVFTQAGGYVTWLPIDASLNHLWQQHGASSQACKQLENFQANVLNTLKRSTVYPDHFLYQQTLCQQPEKLIDLINGADGLFINGGDQSLTVNAFKNKDGSDNELLTAIKKRLNNNQIIVGGTSAGTAVMSGGSYRQQHVPMITNGRSEVALVRGAKKDVLPQAGCNKADKCDQAVINDDLTYNSTGGLGLFNWGILDTHFSERGREGRLAKLALATNTQFGFGVDEATALLVAWQQPEQISLKVVGQSGVYITELAKPERQTKEKSSKVITHYLTRDDTATLANQQLSIRFADWKKAITQDVEVPNIVGDVFDSDRFQKFTHALCLTTQQGAQVTSHWQNTQTPIALTKLKSWQQATGIVQINDKTINYCSYQNLSLSIK